MVECFDPCCTGSQTFHHQSVRRHVLGGTVTTAWRSGCYHYFCWTEKPGSNSLTKYRSSQPNAQSKIGRPKVASFRQVCLQLPRGTTQSSEQQALPAVTNKTKAPSCGPMPARQLAWPRVPQGNRSPHSVAAVAMASHTEWPC